MSSESDVSMGSYASECEEENFSDDSMDVVKPKQTLKSKKNNRKTVEQIYQKKSQVEHVLLRPDTYIGSVERVTQPMYVVKDGRIKEREITYTPGLYKIFDEIVVNAADNKQRDPDMSKLEIIVDAENNKISVFNNGDGIPVVMHKEHQMYIPTMIFGHLLTGSNFDDGEKKTTGGRNGYGAKLANVFSTEFIVECASTDSGLKFRQVFRNNMSVAEEPVVKKLSAAEAKRGDFVRITFSPDLPRFGMESLDEDAVGLLSKRAYDIAGSMGNAGGKKLTVSLNGEKLGVKNFKQYLALFDGIDPPVAYHKSDRWEVGVGPSPDQTPRQISFVNSIATSKGGEHVKYIADQVAAHLVATVKKKSKQDIKPAQIKNNMTIFVNCLIENATFDSQTKDFMTTRKGKFGSKFEVPKEFLKLVDKSIIVDMIVSQADRKMMVALKRKNGTKKSKLTGIPKLDDANFAGSKNSKDCTLIITEGDSAKALAMSGISVVGRDYYGVFPLRGKLLNVRDATKAMVLKNVEISHLISILGLKYETVYDEKTVNSLRYGHLIVMSDQDADGSHIKGLVINLFHRFWPSLLNVPGFLQQFITPIVKVTKGKKSRSFFTLPEYQGWLGSTENNGKGFNIRYYKGLGTSTSKEAKEYFSNLDEHRIDFACLEDDVGEEVAFEDGVVPDATRSGSDLIDMAFRKSRVEDRKVWLNSVENDTYLDYKEASASGGVKFSDFVNKELVLFSKYDVKRSVACFVDGFKPSQRKVLFGCFKRKLSKGEIKVAQLTGYIAEHAAYHHGEVSLQGTIVNMAQSYIGSNNINLLTPSGQFGTRMMGGKDAASARYIFTKLEPITRLIFHPDDDELLTYEFDDGMSIEPEFYMPVIPMVLVNGSEGIGTGWSTNIPNHNPRDIIANLKRLIANEEPQEMLPYYHGWKGSLEFAPKTKGYTTKGCIERVDDTTLLITELPLKKWTQDYKVFCEKMLSGEDTKIPKIADFKENHTDTTVSFTVTADKDVIDRLEKETGGLLSKLKLTGNLSMNNMNLFDEEGRIVHYDTSLDILRAFFEIRLQYYSRRKDSLVAKLHHEQTILLNKARFVEEVCNGELVVSNRKRADILNDLHTRGYFLNTKDTQMATDHEEDESDDEDDTSTANLSKCYEYLLGMKIWTLTFEKVEALRNELETKTEALKVLTETTPEAIWNRDLDAILEALAIRDEETDQLAAAEQKALKANQKHQTKAAKKKATVAKKKKGKKKGNWDSEMETDSDGVVSLGSDSDDMFVSKKAPTKATTKRLAQKRPSPLKKQEKKVVAKAIPVKAAKIAIDSDSDDAKLELSLADRMKRKLVVSPPAKPLARSVLEQPKDPSPRSNASDSEDEIPAPPASMFASLGQIPVKKFQSSSNEMKKVGSKVLQPVKRNAAPKKTVTKSKKKVVYEESDSEDEFAFDASEDEAIPVKKAAPRSRRERAARTYAVESDSEAEVSDF